MPYVYFALGFIGFVTSFLIGDRALTRSESRGRGYVFLFAIVIFLTSQQCLSATGFMHFWLWVATYIIGTGVFIVLPSKED